MAISDAQLSYETHVAFYMNLGSLSGDAQQDAPYLRQAEHMHVLCVIDALLALYGDATVLSQKMRMADADLHLRFGVARRIHHIWLSLRELVNIIDPSRDEALPRQFVHEAERSLNVIYINIRGALDNFAWCLKAACEREGAKRLSPIQTNIFRDDFQAAVQIDGLPEFTKQFSGWIEELASRRDPAAHRIPLSIPPAIIDANSRDEYHRVSSAYDAAIKMALSAHDDPKRFGHFEAAEALHEQLERVGAFHPVFYHHPDEGFIRIYPTVPEDAGMLVRVCRGLTQFVGQFAART